ncbi:hypothetical protein HK100_005832 [Physocladia obscura]|uniref:Peptidylprolyl isomerase n=1 Tax=Physocladia obscura TaxID=109957 RepID=A0AAD5SR68_9FUNG|nr:hypothetical protein HK100_005832 [Physocladia obscura]
MKISTLLISLFVLVTVSVDGAKSEHHHRLPKWMQALPDVDTIKQWLRIPPPEPPKGFKKEHAMCKHRTVRGDNVRFSYKIKLFGQPEIVEQGVEEHVIGENDDIIAYNMGLRDMSYGDNGKGDKIPPGASLTIEVTLDKIIDYYQPPEEIVYQHEEL